MTVSILKVSWNQLSSQGKVKHSSTKCKSRSGLSKYIKIEDNQLTMVCQIMSPNMCERSSRGDPEPYQTHEGGSARALVASSRGCIIANREPPSRTTKFPRVNSFSTRMLPVAHVYRTTLHPRAPSPADQCAFQGRQCRIPRSTPEESFRALLTVGLLGPGLRCGCEGSYQRMSNHADGRHGPCKVVLCRV